MHGKQGIVSSPRTKFFSIWNLQEKTPAPRNKLPSCANPFELTLSLVCFFCIYSNINKKIFSHM